MRIGNIVSRSMRWMGAQTPYGYPQIAKAVFDPSAVTAHRAIGAHGLGISIPDNAIVVGGWVEVLTTFASAGADAGTIAVSIQSANDIVSAVAISDGANPWDAGQHAIVPKINTPESTSIKLTAAREITATSGGQALTAGKANIFLVWVPSE
jgi:hypothetical protein